MKIFVTGATGYLGSAIAARLIAGGHTVFGLVRTDGKAEAFAATGGRPVRGDLATPREWQSEMQNCDAVVHTAIAGGAQAAALDQRTLETVRAAAADGRVRRLLFTSGVWVHGDTQGICVDESSPLAAAETVKWRPAHENLALDLSGVEVKAVVLRPGMVYGGGAGTFADWFREAREHGTIRYPGDGHQRWGMVHRDDVAEAYALALEHANGGERYLLVDETRFAVRELAEAAARASGATARARGRDETLAVLGADGAAQLMDQQFTAGKARRELGWVPRHTSFVAEAETLHAHWQTIGAGAVG
jgi:nucleoside-diphosphate-sugar epimerase